MNGKKLLVSTVILALLQIGFLSWIIAGRAAVLRNGKEVLLKVAPIDPRDLLRGDYVRLNYEIGSIPVRIVTNGSTDPESEGGPVFVRLGKDEDGYWRPRSATFGTPESPQSADEMYIRGEVRPGWTGRPEGSLNVSYGIERYYVPEGQGRAIETDIREHPLSILTAIGPDGRAQIKALMDGQTRLYDEPLF